MVKISCKGLEEFEIFDIKTFLKIKATNSGFIYLSEYTPNS